MDPTEEDRTDRPPGDDLPVRVVTVNDVVSMNLAHFRKAAGLTQQELADRLGWLKSVVSTAERSWEAKRSRNFTANDLIEIAVALGLPIAAFLLPPEDDGTAVTYMVDGLHGTEPQPLRNLVPMVMSDLSTYIGESAAEKEFRRRLFATEPYRRRRARLQETENDRVRSARELIRSIAGQAVAAAGGDPAAVDQVEREATRRVDGQLALFLDRHAQLEREVDELRAFERGYRRRLLADIEDQVRGYWTGVEGVDPEKVLGAMRDQVTRGQRTAVDPPSAKSQDDGQGSAS